MHERIERLGHAAGHAVLPWTLASLAAAVLGSIINTGSNMAALEALDVAIASDVWLKSALHDLYSFMPFYFVIVACAAAAAFPVAEWLAARAPRWRLALLTLAGAVGLAVAFAVANRVSPMPTVVAAAREPLGYFSLLLTGAAAGAVFAYLNRSGTWPRNFSSRAVLHTGASVAIVAALTAMHFDARLAAEAPPASELRPYTVETVADGLSHPWGLAILPDGSLLVTERPGRLRLIDASGKLAANAVPGTPESLPGGQGGLMDIQLSPDFADSGLLYLTYACGEAERNNTCLSKARFDGSRLSDHEQIFASTPFTGTSLQYGSRLTFLEDGTLLMTLGDKFDFREQAQNLGSHLGKVVRVDAGGDAPGDNPFEEVEGAEAEIFSFGHRNPQGIDRDPETGRIFVSEHGPRGGDEINIVEAGGDYGWPKTIFGVNYPGDLVSPFSRLEGVRDPIHYWRPSIAPSGLAVYRGRMFPELNGDLLVAALSGRAVYRLELSEGRVVRESRLFADLDKRIRNVRVASDGSIYLLTDHDPGQVLRVTAREFDISSR